jgi:hypothetical protein
MTDTVPAKMINNGGPAESEYARRRADDDHDPLDLTSLLAAESDEVSSVPVRISGRQPLFRR